MRACGGKGQSGSARRIDHRIEGSEPSAVFIVDGLAGGRSWGLVAADVPIGDSLTLQLDQPIDRV